MPLHNIMSSLKDAFIQHSVITALTHNDSTVGVLHQTLISVIYWRITVYFQVYRPAPRVWLILLEGCMTKAGDIPPLYSLFSPILQPGVSYQCAPVCSEGVLTKRCHSAPHLSLFTPKTVNPSPSYMGDGFWLPHNLEEQEFSWSVCLQLN